MTEKSNAKAFDVNDLKPDKSHLISGKTGDGVNADPLATAKHSRQEVDELIQLGKKARGEATIALDDPKTWEGIGDYEPELAKESNSLPDESVPWSDVEELNIRLNELEKRLVKAFKHMGFNF